ncbi:MAG: DMT family transporter [Rhodospirillaceae bacterium]|nr:DMT family transporter [Rhodospirillaceae bacterium]
MMSDHPSHSTARTVLLTATAMLAFAANSLLCRQALGQGLIDAATFASLRVIAGAATLILIVMVRRRSRQPSTANWRSAAMLFTYMVFFSFAYLSLGAGTGALILFGAVQLTMFVVALRGGEHFAKLSWAGLALAVFGLVYLVSPGVTAPDPTGAILMAIAGVAWGAYSLLGRGATDPLEATARNFTYCVPLVLVVSLVFWQDFSSSPTGLILAVASGALASGCGYVVWYAVLPALSATRAATVQLSVPAIASFGGVVLLSEDLTLRLVLASAATLGGVAIVLAQRATRAAE